jgi:hypothetical protein
MNGNEQLISEVKKHGKESGGKTAYLKYLRGETIHRAAAVKAMCFSCSGYYADGRVDCENSVCPLYPFMPYRGKTAGAEETAAEKSEEIILNETCTASR